MRTGRLQSHALRRRAFRQGLRDRSDLPLSQSTVGLLGGVPGAQTRRTVCYVRVDHDRQVQLDRSISQETEERYFGEWRRLHVLRAFTGD